jgi:acyl carrier protein
MNLRKIITDAIATINEELQIDALKTLEDDTPLFELLDSLGTLDLILELESVLEEETGRYIAVADEKSMNKDKTPFKTLLTLEEYLRQRIAHESH